MPVVQQLAPSTHPPPPCEVEGVIPLQKIGRGVYASVWLATYNNKQVVVKYWNPNPQIAKEITDRGNLSKEASILRLLEGVPDVIRVVAVDSSQVPARWLILSPHFVGKQFGWDRKEHPLECAIELDDQDAIQQAIASVFTTGANILNAGVANPDQQSNIMFAEDGTVLFIDFGLAVTSTVGQLTSESPQRYRTYVEKFVRQCLMKMPEPMWRSCHGDALFESLFVDRLTNIEDKASATTVFLNFRKELGLLPASPAEVDRIKAILSLSNYDDSSGSEWEGCTVRLTTCWTPW